MLVLTRKKGQQLLIGDDITIDIVDVQGDNVRIAIEAPRQVKIYRRELYDAIAAENKAAADITQADLSKMLTGR